MAKIKNICNTVKTLSVTTQRGRKRKRAPSQQYRRCSNVPFSFCSFPLFIPPVFTLISCLTQDPHLLLYMEMQVNVHCLDWRPTKQHTCVHSPWGSGVSKLYCFWVKSCFSLYIYWAAGTLAIRYRHNTLCNFFFLFETTSQTNKN